MDEPFTCSCQMKTDLENSADVFSFFKENYPLPGIVDNLNKLSNRELRCACCLMGVALVALSQKKTIWERLKTMGLGNKEYSLSPASLLPPSHNSLNHHAKDGIFCCKR